MLITLKQKLLRTGAEQLDYISSYLVELNPTDYIQLLYHACQSLPQTEILAIAMLHFLSYNIVYYQRFFKVCKFAILSESQVNGKQ